MSHRLNCVQKQPPCFLGFGPLLHRISVTREMQHSSPNCQHLPGVGHGRTRL